MGIYYNRRGSIVLLQNLHGPTSLMNVALKWGKQIAIGGILGFCLSVIFAEYTSLHLYAHYQSWTGWRSITGSNPNYITSLIQKISWAVFFLSAWFMIWKLDSFLILTKKSYKESEEKPDMEESKQEKTERKKKLKTEKTESDQANGDYEDTQTAFEPEENSDGTIFSSEDLKYAKVLGLEEPFQPEEIKSTYRKIIAQYHPDRVIAMGPEIKEVAEKKAKEINEAYEHLRKSLNLS